MPKTIDIQCPIKIYGDSERRSMRFVPDPDVVETISSYEHAIVRDVTVPVSTANEAQSIQDVTAPRGVYIEMDSDFDLFLNGAVTPLEFRKQDAADEDEKLRFFSQCTITSIGIGNPSATVVLDGVLVVFGDLDA